MTGKLLVGQAGGATAVINRSLIGVVQEATRAGCFDSIWGMRRGAEGALEGDLVDLGGISRDKWQAIGRTPGAALGSSRHRISDEEANKLLDLCRRHDVRAFIYIGGNDSADTTHRIARLARDRGQDICAIAVPKTIDNDLPITDHSPGYGSIARFLAIATMDSAKDTESMPTMYPVKIVEVMGRDAGWVVASASLGKRSPEDAPHLLYIPERPLSRERFLRDLMRTYKEHGRVVAVVGETIRDENGRPFADPDMSDDIDAFGHPLLRGTASSMCQLIQKELGLRARYDKPGSLQRMSMLCASSTDLAEAEEVGRAAVRLVVSGITDRMVTLVRNGDRPYDCSTDSHPLAEIANRQQLLPSVFLREDNSDTTRAFRRYAIPLLGPEPLPTYARLPNIRLE
jgi:ATP-dependent phosphofructokinase / diphosphate-dependent phosphofructokinase